MIKQMVKGVAEHYLFYRDAERTFFQPEEFPWEASVEAKWKTIRRELDKLMRHRARSRTFRITPPSRDALPNDDRWRTFYFYQFGYVEKENCARCPETVRILKEIPGMNTAIFSILAPGKYIPPHRGAYKGVLRYHLGFLVPKPEHSCRIRVGNDIRHWQKGKSLIFDDSHVHEVWNDSNSYRVVLFVNFTRPTVFPLSLVNRLLIWIRCQRKKVT